MPRFGGLVAEAADITLNAVVGSIRGTRYLRVADDSGVSDFARRCGDLRVLSYVGLLSKWKGRPSKKGTGLKQPDSNSRFAARQAE
jgi:hypothetical protein